MPLNPPFPRPPTAETPSRVLMRRRTLVGLGSVAALALAWAGTTSWYIYSHDEIALRFFAGQTELRYAYEDRIADLKAKLEREITQNLVERNGFGAKAEALARRQAEIETRQLWLSSLADRMAGKDPPAPGRDLPPAAEPVEHPAPPPRPSPVSEIDTAPQPLSEPFQLRPGSPPPGAATTERPPERLGAVERSLERVAASAVRVADLFRNAAQTRADRIRIALDGTGLDLGRRLATAPAPPAGGPFVPAPSGFDGGLYAGVMSSTGDGLADLDRLLGAIRLLPLGRPLASLEGTSGFGYRIDPFTRAPALHTGLDFRAETGSPVRATASGTVVVSDWAAGYGNMVEIDHGRGIATRYGHLSAISVPPGAVVEAGRVVGRVGSTGRSTGPHLHYEVRVDGEPVDPNRFLRAGRLLATTER